MPRPVKPNALQHLAQRPGPPPRVALGLQRDLLVVRVAHAQRHAFPRRYGGSRRFAGDGGALVRGDGVAGRGGVGGCGTAVGGSGRRGGCGCGSGGGAGGGARCSASGGAAEGVGVVGSHDVYVLRRVFFDMGMVVGCVSGERAR
jgi:hypothetical protein